MFGMNRVFSSVMLLLLCLSTTASSCGPRLLSTAEPCAPGKQVWFVAKGQNIQDAVDAAKAAGGGEVWVAQGIYKLSKELVLRPDVDLYGGFQGSETKCSERAAININVDSPGTILDGKDNHVVLGRENSAIWLEAVSKTS